MRYFDFIKEIKEISTSHILVNEYGEGDIYEYLNNGEHKYPCIFLTVTKLNTTDSGTAINFTLFYTDRLVENQANKTAIQSTGISVIKQILSRYEQLHPEYLLSNVNYTPFTEKFTDMCAGVFCDVVIENQIDTLEDYDNECEEGAFTVKTITLTKNGVYDIIGYDEAIVAIPEVPLAPITITENGVYVPEQGGYNEVTVALPEIQPLVVSSIKIDNSCIENGRWAGETYFSDVIYLRDMSNMFNGCNTLQKLDVSNWNTGDIIKMNNIFYNCTALNEIIGLENLNVSNVFEMNHMFAECNSIQTLDLSNWNTELVTDMSYLFYNCTSLNEIIGLENLNVSNVTNMSDMFYNSHFTTFDLSGWDTRNLKYIGSMFYASNSIQTLNLSGWNTENLTNMSNAFGICKSLTELDLSGWNVEKVTNMNNLFRDCILLKQLDISNWKTNSLSQMDYLFYNCTSLTSLDLSGWNTSKVKYMSDVFEKCKLDFLDITGWSAEKVSYINYFSYNATIPNYVGGRTIDEVIEDNITILNGLNVSVSYLMSNSADRASLRALINGLYDLSSTYSKTLYLGNSLKAKLTEEDIAIATAKNWTIA